MLVKIQTMQNIALKTKAFQSQSILLLLKKNPKDLIHAAPTLSPPDILLFCGHGSWGSRIVYRRLRPGQLTNTWENTDFVILARFTRVGDSHFSLPRLKKEISTKLVEATFFFHITIPSPELTVLFCPIPIKIHNP